MLMNRIAKSYRDLVRQGDLVQPIVSIPDLPPAANANKFSQSDVQARRLRRQQRQARTVQSAGVAWRIRAW